MAKGSIQHNDSARHILLCLIHNFSSRYTQRGEALRLLLFAVRAGFEPAVRLPVRQFSKLVVSATHPSHQN